MERQFNIKSDNRFVSRFNLRYLLVALVIILGGLFIRLDYYIVKPSRAVELSDLITVEGKDPDDQGAFFLVTVSQQRAAPLTIIYALINPYLDINPIGAVIPRGMDEEEYRLLQAENMNESRLMAQVVALRRTGYEIEIASEGVEVVGFLENAPAEPDLKLGDRLLAIDGKQVFLASEVPLLVQDRQVGESVNITLMRNGSLLDLKLTTGKHPEEEDLPFLGIYIKTLPWVAEIPLDIAMDTGRIGGPSAGMMFTLEILNQLVAEDLTAGRRIAGTGTIDFTENIGRIGGVTQKVVAAERAGADYFLVPEANYESAHKAARRITVVPVDNLEQALSFLATLEPLD
jgi:Lon-like protease